MITTVKEDPSQMRLAIYEFARARLKTDTSWANEAERKRLLASLETAICGVEDFAVAGGDKARIEASTQPPQLGGLGPPEETPGTSVVEIHRPEPPQTVVPGEGGLFLGRRCSARASSGCAAHIKACRVLGRDAAAICCGGGHRDSREYATDIRTYSRRGSQQGGNIGRRGSHNPSRIVAICASRISCSLIQRPPCRPSHLFRYPPIMACMP